MNDYRQGLRVNNLRAMNDKLRAENARLSDERQALRINVINERRENERLRLANIRLEAENERLKVNSITFKRV